jgi:hypothetical protein
MGFFKGFKQFAKGAAEGVTETLPGLMEGARRSKELQEQRNFQLELQNDAQDYTSEQSLLDRIGRITTAHEAQTLLESASLSGNLAAQDAAQARLDGLNRAEEMRKEQLTETDQAARERLTFAQGLTDQSRRNRDDRAEKLATAERERQNVNAVIDNIMMDRSGNRNRRAKYDLAITAAEGYPGIIKRLRVMQEGDVDWSAHLPGDHQNAAAAWPMAQSMYEKEWGGYSSAEKIEKYIGVLRGMGIRNPYTERQQQVPKFVKDMIAARTPVTKNDFLEKWTNWALTGGPGTGRITKQVSLQALQESGLFGGAAAPPGGAPPGGAPEPFFKGPPGSASAKVGGIAESIGGAAKWFEEGIEATGGLGRERPSRFRQTGRAGRAGGPPEDRTQVQARDWTGRR